MASDRDKAALITDAERSPADQLRARQIRYAVMMGVRILLLIVGSVLVMTGAPLLWLWLVLCAIGMVVLPWVAVLVANDRPPKAEHRLANKFHRSPPDDGGETRGLPDRNGEVIDADQ